MYITKKLNFFIISIITTVLLTSCGSTQSKSTKDNSSEADSNLCDPDFILVYGINTDHPSASISSSGNKVKIYKSCWKKDKKFKHLNIYTAGSFTNSPNKYKMYYSSSDKPPYGYSILDYYSGTQYNGLSERYMYASRSKSELITKVTNDIDNKDCKRYAANTSGGNLNSNSNFWTYFCPKKGLLDDLNKL